MIALLSLLALLAASPMLASVHELAFQEDPRGGGIRLTRPDGTIIYVNPHAIAFVRTPLEGEHGNATVVFSSGAKQSVTETVDEVLTIIQKDMRDKETDDGK